MRCPENQRKFYEAFYGVVPQSHIYRKMHKEFEGMMKKFKGDMVSEFPDVAEELVADGLLAGLEAMRDEGAERPTVYFKHENLATTAFKTACSKIRTVLKAEADKKRAREYELISEDEMRVLHEMKMGIRAGLMVKLERHIQTALASGVEDIKEANIMGYCSLLEATPHPEGYEYALLGYILPTEMGFYWHEKVVEAMNAHPAFRTMNRKSTKPGPLAETVRGITG